MFDCSATDQEIILNFILIPEKWNRGPSNAPQVQNSKNILKRVGINKSYGTNKFVKCSVAVKVICADVLNVQPQLQTHIRLPSGRLVKTHLRLLFSLSSVFG